MPAYLNAIYNLEGTIKEFWKNLNCNCRQKENLEANPLIPQIDLLTLSETQYDWRQTEQVTMKANFIQFWCAESEFIVKNQFHYWTSELGCIWYIFGKIWVFKHFSTVNNQLLQINWGLLTDIACTGALKKSQK